MNRYQTLLILAAGHGLNDFVAGYLLGNLLHLHLPVVQSSLCFFVYNALAFGGQYFAALSLNQTINKRKVYITIWLLNAVALLSFPVFPQFSFLAAGCASALYHVLGGSIAAEEDKAASIGWFAAPGILGLALAGYFASQQINLWVVLVCLTISFSGTAFFINFSPAITSKEASPALQFDKHDALMVLLLTLITLRSALWNIFQLIHQQNYSWLLAIAISAFTGKILGGYISDRIGWRVYNLLSLMAAAPLVSFCKNELLLFCIGVALLQSGIPANTAMLLYYMKTEKEKAVALAFGTGVFAAGVILFFPAVTENVFWNTGLLVSAIAVSLYISTRHPSYQNRKAFNQRKLLAPAKRIVLKSH